MLRTRTLAIGAAQALPAPAVRTSLVAAARCTPVARSLAPSVLPTHRSFHLARTTAHAPPPPHAAAAAAASKPATDSSQSKRSEQEQEQEDASGGSASPPAAAAPGHSWQTKVGVLFFLGTACFTFYLGVWQVNRRSWKQSLISRREAALAAEPIELQAYLAQRPQIAVADRAASIDAAAEVLEAANDLKRVTTRGRFLYDKTQLVGPRNPPSSDNTSTAGQGSGFYLVTPLRLASGQVILVNRGWCAQDKLATGSRETPDLSEEVEVVGVVRKGEQQPQFLDEYDPAQAGSWIWLDLPRMARVVGIGAGQPSAPGGPPPEEPVLVDALEVAANRNRNMKRRSLGEFVVFTTTPMIHTVYAGTWFTLSAALVALTYIRFKRKIPIAAGRPKQPAVAKRQ